jgi:hypothetical protein
MSRENVEWDLTRMGWIEGQGVYRGKSDVKEEAEDAAGQW